VNRFPVDLALDWRRIDQLTQRLAETDDLHHIVDSDAREDATLAAGKRLEWLYTGYERMIEVILDYLGDDQPAHGGRYHEQLLNLASIESPSGIRPALVSPETLHLLDTLRRFRHLSRHAYGRGLDPRATMDVVRSAAALFERFRGDLSAFAEAIHAELPEIEGLRERADGEPPAENGRPR